MTASYVPSCNCATPPSRTATSPLRRSYLVAPSETRSHSSTDWRNFQTRISAQSGARHGLPRRTTESLREHSRPIRPLAPGERVFLQNQQGASPTKWDRSGIVVESLGHDQYRVKIGRLILRNRRLLRAYTSATLSIELQPATLPSPLETVRTASQSASPLDRLAEESFHPSMLLPDCQERPIPPPPAAAPRGVPTVYPPLPTPEGHTPAVDTPQTISPQVLPSKRCASPGTSSTTSLSTTVIVTPLTPATIPAAVRRTSAAETF